MKNKEVKVLSNGRKIVIRKGINKFLYQHSTTLGIIALALVGVGCLLANTVSLAGESEEVVEKIVINITETPEMLSPLEMEVEPEVVPVVYTATGSIEEVIVEEPTETVEETTEIEVVEETVEETTETEVEEYNPRYDSNSDLYILAHLLFAESGSDWCEDKMIYYTGSVVLNRVNSDLFPNTIKDVVFQQGQYACTWDGNYYKEPTERCWRIAEELLNTGSVLPSDVVFQAQFVQGSGVYEQVQNMYYCYK